MDASVKVHDFYERLAFSEGVTDSPDLICAIANMVQGATGVIRASEEDDRNGTDYWITRCGDLPAISVDVKRRSFCPREKFGSDDACIETTSIYKGPQEKPFLDKYRARPGWSIDSKKRTDFIAYTWPHDCGERFWIIPFVPLCRAATINWRAWAVEYGERPAVNNSYLTLSIYPPRVEIARAMRVLMRGVA